MSGMYFITKLLIDKYSSMLKPVQLPSQFGFNCVKLQVSIELQVKLCKIPVNVTKIQLFKTQPASNPLIQYQTGKFWPSCSLKLNHLWFVMCYKL